MLRMCGRSIELTARGRLLLRNVAMVFDAYLPANTDVAFRTPFSRAV
jgi:coproporphyrinogen III oxidase-like Fe-S oxidoreductase